jgi:transcriptional regulator GlxA family with amidase domain
MKRNPPPRISRRHGPPRRVVIVAFDAAQLLDIAGPLQTFSTTCEMFAGRGETADPRRPYDIALVSPTGGPVRTTSGLVVETQPLAAAARRPIDTLIAVGGLGVHGAVRDARLVRWFAGAAARARRVCSVCTGAFLLAEAGLLAGRRATTHWEFCAQLKESYPDIKVEADPIYVRDGRIWTSAGITAGIDLALALVEEDLGRPVALQVARHLVVFLKRPGGQAQFSEPLKAQAATIGPADQFAALHAWMADNLASDLNVDRLAAQAGMSPRHFARLYTARHGTTPAKAVEVLRVEAARRTLEETPVAIKRVAAICGFGDEERMRRSFLRRLGLSPLDYRRRFAGPVRGRGALAAAD